MGKGRLLLDGSPKYVASFSMAYSQARPWAPIRTAVVRGLLVFVVVWLLATTASLLMPSATRLKQLAAQHVKYVLVIDSGSSGTRIYAYKWTLPEVSKPGALPFVQGILPTAAGHLIPKKAKAGLYNRVETQPGLDAYLGNPDGLLTDALEPLLTWARAVVPAAQHASTPLFLLGTGGLRRMEQQAAQQLMQDIRQHLKQSGFRFEDPWARVVTGSQEGIYGWLALNYQQGRLQQHLSQPASTAPALPPTVSTQRQSSGHQRSEHPFGLPRNPLVSLGALDMGGSSLEMTFEVDMHSQQLATGSEFQNATLWGKTFYLHTYTFKKYGLNEAYDRAVTLLLNKQHGTDRQKQQQQSVRQAPQQVQVVGQLQGSVAATAATDASDANGDVKHYGSGFSSSSSGEASRLFDHQLHADLAAAAAAGLQVHPAGLLPAVPAARSPGTSAMEVDLQVMQHRQADLAVAAAAGLHPTPSAAVLAPVHQVEADAAVGAVGGVLPAVQQTVAQYPAHDLTNNTSRAPGSRGTSTPSDSVVIPPGTHQASQHNTVDTTPSRAAASHQAVATTTVELQTLSNHRTPGYAEDNLATNPQLQWGGQPSASLLLRASTAEPRQPAIPTTGGRRRRRGLLQHSRQQRRHHRQLLLQQHAEELQGYSVVFSRLAAEIQGPGPPQKLLSVWHAEQQHDIQLSEEQKLLGSVHQLHQAVARASDDKLGCRKLLAQGVPPDGPSIDASLQPQGEGQQASRTFHAPGSTTLALTGDTLAGSTSNGPGAGTPDVQQSSATPVAVDLLTPPPATVRHVMPELPIVVHPCLHEGYEEPYERIAYDGQQPQPSKVMLRGSPSWHSCLTLIGDAVNATAPCCATPQRPVCRLGSAQPQVQGMFLALTGFHVVTAFLGVPSNATLEGVLDASQEFCSRPWSWVQQHLGEQMNAERYCTWGPYMVKLLREGLLLSDAAVRVGGGDLGWPLGAALYEAGKLPEMLGQWRKPSVGPMIRPGRVTWGELRVKSEGQHAGNTDETVAGYSEQSSLAWRLWGSHHRLHMGQVSIAFVCVMAWLFVVVFLLPTTHHGVAASLPGPWSLPGHAKSSGRALVSSVLPAAGYYRGRNSPNTNRSSVKH